MRRDLASRIQQLQLMTRTTAVDSRAASDRFGARPAAPSIPNIST
jgi:hypothetical protein